MDEESKYFDLSAPQAVVAAAAERFDGDILLVPDRGRWQRGSEGGELDARTILAQCLSLLNELEKQTLDTTTPAFVRVASS